MYAAKFLDNAPTGSEAFRFKLTEYALIPPILCRFFRSAINGARRLPDVALCGLDRDVTEEELDLFSACDVVWLGYKGHYGMSGVLVQAYRFVLDPTPTQEAALRSHCGGQQHAHSRAAPDRRGWSSLSSAKSI